MQIGKLIGKGATAEVFDYEDNKVIKLYNLGTSKTSLIWEYNKMMYAHKNHVPCPEVFNIIDLNDRFGYTMEKYYGITVKEKLLNDIKKVISNEMTIELFSVNFFDSIKGIARALYKVHKVKIPEWEQLADKLLLEVKLTDQLSLEEKNVINKLIENLPKDTAVCHGDPNPNNIMFCEGEYKFIDWVNAGIGNPLYDIAEYVWLNTPNEKTNYEGVPQKLIDFYFCNKDLVIPTFINEYEMVSGKDISSYEEYIIPVLVRKLHSNRTEEEKSRIVFEIRDRLNKLY